ncbi:MAG: methionyl-tRNA formyltransferase [Alicyclobacillaceae bacterium]|nr:methionyl-tRNA formyltransferase [Alicyclobacillaceae bacterium]
MGTPDFAVPSLRALIEAGYEVAAVVTQPDRPVGRKKVLMAPPVKRAAEEFGIPVWQPERVRTADFLDQVRRLGPDVVVTAAYGKILPQEFLDIPPFGCLNVHASLLPRYRGAAPIQWCLINGERETGITIMKMVQALDAGPILDQAAIAVGEDDDTGSLHDRLARLGAERLQAVLPKWLRGELSPQEQDERLATYAPVITREEERVDWAQSARAVYNRIRAMHPWPGAFTVFRGKVLKLWKSRVAEETGTFGAPGEILDFDETGVFVAAGEGLVRLTEVQSEGKNRMEAGTWARGQHFRPGDKLGA